ncbi:MAG TPA: phosphotransferase [Ktedonobacterales bacterium]
MAVSADLPALADIAHAWPFVGPPQALMLTPLHGGTNNTLFRVSSATSGGSSFVLRPAAAQHDEQRLRLECDVLAALQGQKLPFATPAPLLTADGAPWAKLSMPDSLALATLTRVIAGRAPDRSDPAQAEAAGEAIGALDVALACIDAADDTAATTWRTGGALDQISPLVPDPPAAFARLALPLAKRDRLRSGYAALMERLPALYDNLPYQLCHEDTATTNLLMDGNRVTGILDFEFLARDLRPTDLVVALVWWPVDVLGLGLEWPLVSALARGYARSAPLTQPEIAAIPTLYRMRGYTSLIHRLGLALQGRATMAYVADRADAALAWEDWLDAYQDRLVAVVQQAMDGAR